MGVVDYLIMGEWSNSLHPLYLFFSLKKKIHNSWNAESPILIHSTLRKVQKFIGSFEYPQNFQTREIPKIDFFPQKLKCWRRNFASAIDAETNVAVEEL